eukprot:6587226-Prymnesium_polylepis.3
MRRSGRGPEDEGPAAGDDKAGGVRAQHTCTHSCSSRLLRPQQTNERNLMFGLFAMPSCELTSTTAVVSVRSADVYLPP